MLTADPQMPPSTRVITHADFGLKAPPIAAPPRAAQRPETQKKQVGQAPLRATALPRLADLARLAALPDQGAQMDLWAPRACPSDGPTRFWEMTLPLARKDNSPRQRLLVAAMVAPDTEFNKAMQVACPGWTQPMRHRFVTQTDMEAWSLLVGAMPRAQSLFDPAKSPLLPLVAATWLRALNTSNQWLVRGITDPQAHQCFCHLAATFGTFLAFHGSKRGNWHQIVTQGLEPKSNTPMQANGAAHGQGVYVATQLRLSAGFVDATGETFMGVVQVIRHPSLTYVGDAVIVPHKDLLRVVVLAVHEKRTELPDLHVNTLLNDFKRITGSVPYKKMGLDPV